LQLELCERREEETLDLQPVELLRTGWLGGELDQPIATGALRDELGCHADGHLWVEALAEDESRRELFQPKPL
jgi:hypothetical protein